MASRTLPGELSNAYWDKKKGSIPAGSPLESQLKIFEKKYRAVDWSAFGPGWADKMDTIDELEKGYAALERTCRARTAVLKAEAASVADAAQKLGKEKGLAKPTLDAIRAIVDSAKAFGKSLDEGLEDIAKVHDRAAAALKSSSKGDNEKGPTSALTDPKQLLKQLNLCKRQPDLRAGFAFITDGKSDSVLCVAPRATGKGLYAKLQAETGMKTGSFGIAWIADNTLFLKTEKAYSGLAKKVRDPLQAAGFRIAKVELASEVDAG